MSFRILLTLAFLAQVFHCCALQAGELYGAVAYSDSTRHAGWAWAYSTREEAEAAALKKCNRNDAKIVVWAKDSWISFAHGNGTSHGWRWDGKSEQGAAQGALSECASRAQGCHTVVTFYSGGKGPAKITVSVPESTRVYIGKYEIPIQDGRGEFNSPEVLGGKSYHYTLTARMIQDGQVTEEILEGDVQANRTTHFDFQKLHFAAELGAPPAAAADADPLPYLAP